MAIISRKEPFFLLGGDILCFIISLWLTLAIRYVEIPSKAVFMDHLVPFSFLFIVWIVAFLVAGLYEKHTIIFRSKPPTTILNAQIANSLIAVIFFYFIPYFGITPKTTLFIYLVVLLGSILLWRMYISDALSSKRKQNAFLVAGGSEMKELYTEVNQNKRVGLHFIARIDPENLERVDFQSELVEKVYSEQVSIIVVDLLNEKVNPILPHLYNLIFSQVHFIDMHKVYEDVFDRIPLSILKYNWFLENISTLPKGVYDILKRAMDIVIASVLGLASLIFFPFVYIAIKLDDGGPIFITQERIGYNNKIIRLIKYRSMTVSDGGKWVSENDTRITKVGKFLRKSRIDEFPQLWNVVKGDMSLIGPRPDIYDLGVQLSKEIPYYGIRNIIKPGLSGWAQISQLLPPQSLEETRLRLAYDLYYIKNRSFLLDLRIALRTIKTLLSRAGI